MENKDLFYKLVLRDTLPSWNKIYAGVHWTKRKKLADYWHEIVKWELITNRIGKKEYEKNLKNIPLHIVITCYFANKTKMLDADNICAKLAIDGLVGTLLPDDNYRIINRVTTRTELDRTNPRTEIDINRVNYA